MGLGCLQMSKNAAGATSEEESIATIHRALELGIDFFDTADAYGFGHNEELLGKALEGRRDRALVSTKFGNIQDPNDPKKLAVVGKPEYVRTACEASLRRLRVDVIDLYYQHRVDFNVPIEETVGAMSELVRAGKVRFIGLSEASASSIRRAHAVHPLSALETEWSIFSRDAEEAGIYDLCRELGIGFVAYSPLARGLLTGGIKRVDDLAPDDPRRPLPRFQPENLAKNVALIERIEAVAREIGCTPAQLAIAWVLARGDDVVVLPGMERRTYVEQNVPAVDIRLTPEQLRRLDDPALAGQVAGNRYADMTWVNR